MQAWASRIYRHWLTLIQFENTRSGSLWYRRKWSTFSKKTQLIGTTMQLNSSITIRNFARCSILPRNLMLIQIFKFVVNRRLVQIVWSSQKRRNLSTVQKSVSLSQLSSHFVSSLAKCQSLKLTIRRMVASQSPFTSPWCQITMFRRPFISWNEWGKKALNCKSKRMQPNK